MHSVQADAQGIQPAESLTWGIVPDGRTMSGKPRLHIIPARNQQPQARLRPVTHSHDGPVQAGFTGTSARGKGSFCCI